MKIISRSEARAQELTRFFTGKACKRGHFSERYTLNNGCIECMYPKRFGKSPLFDVHPVSMRISPKFTIENRAALTAYLIGPCLEAFCKAQALPSVAHLVSRADEEAKLIEKAANQQLYHTILHVPYFKESRNINGIEVYTRDPMFKSYRHAVPKENHMINPLVAQWDVYVQNKEYFAIKRGADTLAGAQPLFIPLKYSNE
jgi:hypothetical protein